MQMCVHCKTLLLPRNRRKSCLLLLVFFFSGLAGFAQTLSLSLKNVSLEKAFRAVEEKVEQRFVYTSEMLQKSEPVTIDVRNTTLDRVLQLLFQNQPLIYSLDDRFIKVRFKDIGTAAAKKNTIVGGSVRDEEGRPLGGVTVTSKQTGKVTVTDASGQFAIPVSPAPDRLAFTSVGYATAIITVTDQTTIQVQMKVAVGVLDETIVMAYGTTTRRLSTGNIAKVSAEEIAQQPVSNPLVALEGKVPGLLVTQTNGVPGSAIKLQLRGQSSIGVSPGSLPPNDPLIIIDGIPFAPNNNRIDNVSFGTALGKDGRGALSLINPSDIESIEVLKDADATAIYGSRGANGVILITTKRGKDGKTAVSLSVYSGASRPSHTVRLLGTPDYLRMRREALQNDGVAPNATNAPDLLLWDTTRSTDFKKILTGHNASVIDGELSFSGGSAGTRFRIGGGYHRETTVFSQRLSDQRGSINVNLSNTSANRKFSASFSSLYSADKSNLTAGDLTNVLTLPPNAPLLYDSVGKLNWQEGGFAFNNPLAYLYQPYTSRNENLLQNIQFDYRPLTGFGVTVRGGYNLVSSEDVILIPIASQDPAGSPKGSSSFGKNRFRSWIIEPQAAYTRAFKASKIDFLFGSTWQSSTNSNDVQTGKGYTSDDLLNSIGAAPSVTLQNTNTQFRYTAIFGRFTYTLQNRYLLNLSGRRDGSSRFGPRKRFGNFGAVGAAWIFTSEAFLNKASILSYGKLRGSYGITGNDQIGDYKYLDSWTNAPYPYNGQPGLVPTQLAVSDYGWEVNKKLEGSLDLGFWKDRLLATITYYQNRSSNQLLAYRLPTQTGFPNIAARNFPATVENRGWEILVSAKLVNTKNFSWTFGLNGTVPKNTLRSFPGLATSSYYYFLEEGQSINLLKGYKYTGVNPSSGLFDFEDINHDGKTDAQDIVRYGKLDPSYYGGMKNTLSYKEWSLNVYFDFRKQTGRSPLADVYAQNPPGTRANQPALFLDRWQKPGDNAFVQKLTATSGSPAYNTINNLFLSSSGLYSNASYLRIRTLYASYSFPDTWLKTMHLQRAQVFFEGQNLWTFSPYKGNDPETQSFYTLPTLRTFTAGFTLNF